VRHHVRPLDAPFRAVDANLMGYGVETLDAKVGMVCVCVCACVCAWGGEGGGCLVVSGCVCGGG